MDKKSATVCISLQRPCGFGEEKEALVKGEERRGEKRRIGLQERSRED